MWRALIESLEPGARLNAAAAPHDLDDAEVRLGHALPAELRGLLAETDGCMDASGWTQLAWPLARIVHENLECRSPRSLWFGQARWEDLLCFTEDGAGRRFLIDRLSPTQAVQVWNAVDGASQPMAPTLQAFLRGWISGSLR